jgi:hypothetical protein
MTPHASSKLAASSVSATMPVTSALRELERYFTLNVPHGPVSRELSRTLLSAPASVQNTPASAISGPSSRQD